VSGHARQGELRTLLSVAKPAAFVPVHGEFRHMVHHADLARSMGVPSKQVILCEDGDASKCSTTMACAVTARSPRATSTLMGPWAISVTASFVIESSLPKKVW